MSMRFLQAMQATNRMLISIWEPCPALLVAFVACNAFLLPFPLLCLSGSSLFSGSRSIVTHDVLSSELFSSLLPFEWSGQTGACNVILLPRCLKEHGARLCPGQTIGGNCCKLPLASAFATIELTFDRLGHLATALPPRPVTLIRFSVPGCSPRVSRTTWWV